MASPNYTGLESRRARTGGLVKIARVGLAGMVLALAAMWGCTSGTKKTGDSITVKVVDSDGNPLTATVVTTKGATVIASGTVSTTGNLSLSLKAVAGGEVTAHATDGYDYVSTTIL